MISVVRAALRLVFPRFLEPEGTVFRCLLPILARRMSKKTGLEASSHLFSPTSCNGPALPSSSSCLFCFVHCHRLSSWNQGSGCFSNLAQLPDRRPDCRTEDVRGRTQASAKAIPIRVGTRAQAHARWHVGAKEIQGGSCSTARTERTSTDGTGRSETCCLGREKGSSTCSRKHPSPPSAEKEPSSCSASKMCLERCVTRATVEPRQTGKKWKPG